MIIYLFKIASILLNTGCAVFVGYNIYTHPDSHIIFSECMALFIILFILLQQVLMFKESLND